MVEQRLAKTGEISKAPDIEGAAVATPNPEDDGNSRQLRKSSSLNSMFICTTISKPCVDSIINAVATILNS